jgi:cytochrome c-L
MGMKRKMFRKSTLSKRVLATGVLFLVALAGPALAEVQFRNALDDSPIDTKPIKGEVFTEAVKSFHETGVNPYNGNAEVISATKEIFEEKCAACHNSDGTGRIGPSLIDDDYANKRANTDVGIFEIIHSGASGAMRSFADRGMTQDEMLKLIAYIHSLKK